MVLLLCLGWSRLLVVCSGPHCAAAHAADRPHRHAHADVRLEFAHRCACCERRPGIGADDDGPVARAGHGACDDVAFDIGAGPLPQRVNIDHPDLPVATSLPMPPAPPLLQVTAVRPPNTGPPRPDRRTGLRASTVLLL